MGFTVAKFIRVNGQLYRRANPPNTPKLSIVLKKQTGEPVEWTNEIDWVFNNLVHDLGQDANIYDMQQSKDRSTIKIVLQFDTNSNKQRASKIIPKILDTSTLTSFAGIAYTIVDDDKIQVKRVRAVIEISSDVSDTSKESYTATLTVVDGKPPGEFIHQRNMISKTGKSASEALIVLAKRWNDVCFLE
jgi:hypothetical protein